MLSMLQKIFGTKHQRDIKKLAPLVARINELDEEYKALSESELKGKTDEFRARLTAGEALEDIMCEAFAVVKNACLAIRPDVGCGLGSRGEFSLTRRAYRTCLSWLSICQTKKRPRLLL